MKSATENLGVVKSVVLQNKDGDTITLTVSEIHQLISQLDTMSGDTPIFTPYSIPFPDPPITVDVDTLGE